MATRIVEVSSNVSHAVIAIWMVLLLFLSVLFKRILIILQNL